MTALPPKFWVTSLIGVACGLATLCWLWIATTQVARLQIAVSDFVFVAASGPRWGREVAPEDVVLVEVDERSATQQDLPTFADDLKLYQALLAGGARLVADTRMIADADGTTWPGLDDLLTGMRAVPGTGHLMRDMWLPADWPEERWQWLRPLIAHDLLNMRPNGDSYFAARLYPLLTWTSDGIQESMPLRIARTLRAPEPVGASAVEDGLQHSGIASLWQSHLPDVMSLPLTGEIGNQQAAPYPLADVGVSWLPFPSKSPLIAPAGYWINYGVLPDDWPRVSFGDVPQEARRGAFADKIVLVGFSASIDPTANTFAVPNATAPASATEVLAAALDTLRRPSLMRVTPNWIVWATTIGVAWMAAWVGGSLRPLVATFGVLLMLGIFLLYAVAAYRAGWLGDLVLAPTAILLAAGSAAGIRYAREVRWRLTIIDMFGRYVPKAVVTQLVQRPDVRALALGGVKRQVTVLFADIRGFTSHAEYHAPEKVLDDLNSLLLAMVDCTFEEEGTVDKFIGDAILVLFNAPLDQPDHCCRAARTACRIQQRLRDHHSGLGVGIGVHVGTAIVGNVGTPERMEYTAVGTTVNLAARLCSAAGSGEVVISAELADALSDEFHVSPREPLLVKGIEEPLCVFTLTMAGSP